MSNESPRGKTRGIRTDRIQTSTASYGECTRGELKVTIRKRYTLQEAYVILAATDVRDGTMNGSFGFIHEKIEIKILILFIMRRVPEPITLDALSDLTIFDGGISYFDYAECVADLVKTEHLRFEDNKYSITAKGKHNGKVTENSLPYTVRIKAENRTAAFRASLSRNAMIKTGHTSNPEGGFIVGLSLSDGIGDVLSMDLFATSERQAAALEKGFRNNAERIYNALIEMILGRSAGRDNK